MKTTLLALLFAAIPATLLILAADMLLADTPPPPPGMTTVLRSPKDAASQPQAFRAMATPAPKYKWLVWHSDGRPVRVLWTPVLVRTPYYYTNAQGKPILVQHESTPWIPIATNTEGHLQIAVTNMSGFYTVEYVE